MKRTGQAVMATTHVGTTPPEYQRRFRSTGSWARRRRKPSANRSPIESRLAANRKPRRRKSKDQQAAKREFGLAAPVTND